MVTGDVGDHVDFLGRQSDQITVFDEVVRMLVMLSRIDEIADIVQNGRVLQPSALLLSQVMFFLGLIEQTQCQVGHMQ